VPLNRTKNDEIVTAYDMKAVEKMGLLKMDFLGLTTLTVIDDCLKLIEQTRGEKLDIEPPSRSTIPRRSRRSSTRRSPRASSSLNRAACAIAAPLQARHRGRPDALNALYRPGPDGHDRRLHRAQVGTPQGGVSAAGAGAILKDSLGVIVYQEQVMQIANVLASYSLGEADLLRRAMGKKDQKAMAKQRALYERARRLGSSQGALRAKIFDQMAKFSGTASTSRTPRPTRWWPTRRRI
jgi:DNA polymerase III subunit alpha